MNYLITVVIPYYNNNSTVLRAIESVINQTYKNFEIILINDGSTDNSYEIVSDFINNRNFNNKITHINQKNKGPSAARNIGIKLAKGQYVAFLDADDSWLDNKLEIQMGILEKNHDIDLLGCNFYVIKDNKKSKKYFVKENLVKIKFIDMLFKHYYATPCVIAKRECLEKCGMFKTNQHFMEDSLLFTKIARNYNAYMTNDFLVNTYKLSYGESGLSGKLNEMEKCELVNFIELYRENNKSKEKISFMVLMSASVFSIAKYIRRKLVVLLRR